MEKIAPDTLSVNDEEKPSDEVSKLVEGSGDPIKATPDGNGVVEVITEWTDPEPLDTLSILTNGDEPSAVITYADDTTEESPVRLINKLL